jgi:hypothetical protein
MSLFALLGVPSFAVLAFCVDRWMKPPARRARPELSSTTRPAIRQPLLYVLWGFLYALPCFFLARLLARIFPESYRPFLLFLKVLAQDHLFQLGFLTLAGFSFLNAVGFQELAFFGAGYLSLIAFAGSLAAASGMQDAYPLFLLPVTRMAVLLLWPMLVARQRESFGREQVVLLALLALLPLLGALVGWLFIRQWMIWACVLTAVLLCGSLAWFFYERNQ